MGLTPFDVQNLNSAMKGVGDAFAERRAEEMKQQQLDVEQELRQKMLDAEMRRVTAEEGRQKTLSEGNVDAWLQGDDSQGGVVHFNGPQTGLTQLMQQAEAKGKPFTMMDQPPTAKPQYGIFRTSTPLGDMEFHLSSADEVDTVANLAKKLGGTSKQPGQSGVAGPVQADVYAQKLIEEAESQARAKEAQAASVGPGGTDYAQKLLDEAQQIRADAKQRAAGVRTGWRPEPTDFATETTTSPEDPMNPAAPRISTTRKVPVTALPAAPSGPAFTLMKNPAGQIVKVPRGKTPPAGYTPAQ